MKLSDMISEREKIKLQQIKNYKNKKPPVVKRPKRQASKKKEEKIDWADIMGMNRDVLRRGKGGAFKRR